MFMPTIKIKNGDFVAYLYLLLVTLNIFLFKKAIYIDSSACANTNARKYMLQKLNDNNIPPTHTMQKSAHKNVQSVNNYCHISDKQQYAMSHILTNTSRQPLPSFEHHPSTPTYMSLQQSQTNQIATTRKSMNSHIVGSSTIFENCTITGGTFNVTCNVSEPLRKRSRVL